MFLDKKNSKCLASIACTFGQGFSHLQEHKYRDNVSNSSICICSDDDKMSEHFLLRCHNFSNSWSVLLDKISDILNTELLPEHRIVEILLYGDNILSQIANKLIIDAIIAFIKLSKLLICKF